MNTNLVVYVEKWWWAGRTSQGLAHGWRERLRAAVIRDLQAEMARLHHEQHVITQAGVDPRSNEAAAVVAGIQAVRTALGLSPEPVGDES